MDVATTIADILLARELLRDASTSLAEDGIQVDKGLALLADADTHLAAAAGGDAGQAGLASPTVWAHDTLGAVVLAGRSLIDAGVRPSAIRRVLFRGMLRCDRWLEGV